MKSIKARLEAVERRLSELDITRLPKGKKWTERDFEAFEELCMAQCTQEEIFSVMVHSPTEIDRIFNAHYGMGFEGIYQRYIAEGKKKLLKQQMKHARSNPKVAQWLGIQYLDQSEKLDNCNLLDADFNNDAL